METLLNTNELAARLGTNPGTLTNWRIYGGGPPFVKIGVAVRYRESDVESWLAARTIASTSEIEALR